MAVRAGGLGEDGGQVPAGPEELVIERIPAKPAAGEGGHLGQDEGDEQNKGGKGALVGQFRPAVPCYETDGCNGQADEACYSEGAAECCETIGEGRVCLVYGGRGGGGALFLRQEAGRQGCADQEEADQKGDDEAVLERCPFPGLTQEAREESEGQVEQRLGGVDESGLFGGKVQGSCQAEEKQVAILTSLQKAQDGVEGENAKERHECLVAGIAPVVKHEGGNKHQQGRGDGTGAAQVFAPFPEQDDGEDAGQSMGQTGREIV